ncbi:MAG: hypothetical protein QMC67_02025 [Candidatus Wallbacteria bacterium]
MSGPKCVKLSVERLAAIEEMNKKSLKRGINETRNLVKLKLSELLTCSLNNEEELKNVIEKIRVLALEIDKISETAVSCEKINEIKNFFSMIDKLKKEFDIENKKIVSFLLEFREALFKKINEFEYLKKLLTEADSSIFGMVSGGLKSKIISKFSGEIYKAVIPSIFDFTFSYGGYDKNLNLQAQIFEAGRHLEKIKAEIIEFINDENKACAEEILSGRNLTDIKSLSQFLEQNKTSESENEFEFINKIEALLADLSVIKNSDEYHEILIKYDNIKKETDPRLRFMLYDDFIVFCDSIISNAKKMAAFLNELSGLKNRILSLDELNNHDIETEIEDIERAGKIISLEELKKKVDFALERNLKKEKNKFCGKIIKSAFKELGYECDENFETIMFQNQKAFIHKPSLKNYQVQVISNSENNMLQVEIVRMVDSAAELNDSAPSQEIRDIEVETEFCEDYDKVLNFLKDSGISVIEKMRKKPGEVKIKKVQVSKSGCNSNKNNEFIRVKKNDGK